MKKLYVLLLACVCIQSYASIPDTLKVKSSIKKVTVYKSGAEITRNAIINLADGNSLIKLTNLSTKVVENSIQISGLKNATISSISYSQDYLTKKIVSNKVLKLEQQKDVLLKQINTTQNTIKGYEEERKLLLNNQRINSDNSNLALDKVIEISTYYRKRISEIDNNIYDLKQRDKALAKEVRLLTKEIQRNKGDEKEYRGAILLKLNSSKATQLTLKIKYIVNDAGWYPTYDIKSKGIDSPLTFNYKAHVYQRTGSDWNQVAINLSTGDPNDNAVKPVLDTKYLNFTRNAYRKAISKRSNYSYNPTVRTVAGIVTDDSGVPLPGVNVIVKGTKNGTQTDFDGRYVLNVTGGQELSFSYIGFSSLHRKIHSSTMNIALEADQAELEEVVVTAYPTRSKRYDYANLRKKRKQSCRL